MARPLSLEARTKALDAAQTVVAEVGVDGFTMDEVVRRSGVAKTTLYRHWETSNHLLVSALDCMVAPLPTPDTGTFKGDLEAFLDAVLTLINDDNTVNLVLSVLRAAADDDDLARVHEDMMQERMRPIIEVIERAKARGEIDASIETELALDLIEGPIFSRRMMRGQQLDRHCLQEMIEVVNRALTTGTPPDPA